MPTTETVYKGVKELFLKKGGDVKGCCRSVAQRLHISEEEVEVVVVGKNSRWYKELGYDVRDKV